MWAPPVGVEGVAVEEAVALAHLLAEEERAVARQPGRLDGEQAPVAGEEVAVLVPPAERLAAPVRRGAAAVSSAADRLTPRSAGAG
jgi:hypothetical protein